MGEYVIPEILGGGKTLMVGNIIANQFQDTGNYPFGSALAVTLMVLLMIVLFFLRRYPVDREGGVNVRRHPISAVLSALVIAFLWSAARRRADRLRLTPTHS